MKWYCTTVSVHAACAWLERMRSSQAQAAHAPLPGDIITEHLRGHNHWTTTAICGSRWNQVMNGGLISIQLRSTMKRQKHGSHISQGHTQSEEQVRTA